MLLKLQIKTKTVHSNTEGSEIRIQNTNTQNEQRPT